jgi:quercetin dioxygenase-like cupin family protein
MLAEDNMAIAQTKTSERLGTGHKTIEGTLSTPSLQLDISQEIAQLRQEDSWLRGTGRSSKTLVKHADLRIVLISMKANTRMHEHKATARISIQTISGHVRLNLAEQTVDLPAGQQLVLDQCLPHEVEALADSAFLLTLSWPDEAEIEECRSHAKRKVRHDKT